MFRYIEDAPLLVILDDFVQDLDHLLVQYERGAGNDGEEGEGGGDIERGGEGGGGDVDGQYVALLEMRCLLQQRMNDVQHRWRNIYSMLSTLGGFTGDGISCNYAGRMYMEVHMCCVALPFCLFDLACFFLSSFLLISH